MNSEEYNGPDYDPRQDEPQGPPYPGNEPGSEEQRDFRQESGGAGYDRRYGRNYNNYQYQRPPKAPQPVSGMSIAALILGALSIVCSCCGIGGIIFGSLGIIIAVMSKGQEPMQTNSKIGLGLSIVGLVLGIILTIVFFALGSYAGSSEYIQSYEYEPEPYEASPYDDYPNDSYDYRNNEPQFTPYSKDLEDLLRPNEPQDL